MRGQRSATGSEAKCLSVVGRVPVRSFIITLRPPSTSSFWHEMVRWPLTSTWSYLKRSKQTGVCYIHPNMKYYWARTEERWKISTLQFNHRISTVTVARLHWQLCWEMINHFLMSEYRDSEEQQQNTFLISAALQTLWSCLSLDTIWSEVFMKSLWSL